MDADCAGFQDSMAASVTLPRIIRRFYCYSTRGQPNLSANLRENVKLSPSLRNPTVAAPFEVYSDWEVGSNIRDPCFETVDLSFENTAEAYKNKTNFEIVRALLVFNLCSIRPLVDHNKKVRTDVVLTCIKLLDIFHLRHIVSITGLGICGFRPFCCSA